MSLPCDTNRRLAGPVGTTPVQWSFSTGNPPGGHEMPRTAFEDPDSRLTPGYVTNARAHAQASSESATALARLAQAELSAGEMDAAITAALGVLELGGERRDRAAEFAAVQVLRAGGRAHSARENLREPSQDDDLGRTLRARLAIEDGDLVEAAELVSGVRTFDGLFIAGWLQMQATHYSEAIASFRQAGRLAGPTPDVLINTGYSYAALGQLGQAIKATETAQALAPHRKMIAFNLVNFQLARGAYEQAARALEPLACHHPGDVEIELSLAHIALRAGEPKRANRILQRARTSSSWATAPLIRRAELTSNLAVLRWINGERSLATARKVVIEQLQVSDYESLPIASLLIGLLSSFKDAPELDRLLKYLSEHHDEEKLLFLRVHQATLTRDIDRAASLATRWAERRPCNAVAAAITMQLVGAASQGRQEAIKLGEDALKRSPGDPFLVNNLAFALALEHRVRRARAVLGRIPAEQDTAVVLATRGLIELLTGNVAAGVDGYLKAERLASEQHNPRLARLVALNLQFALHRADPELLAAHDLHAPEPIELPRSMDDDPTVWLLTIRAEREGIAIRWVEDDPTTSPDRASG